MYLDLNEIIEYTNRLEEETKAITRDILRIVWYMRGGLSLSEAFMLSFEEKNFINDIVKENMEWTKDTGMPFI